MTFFLALFALGVTFFEGMLRVSGREFGPVAQYAFPLLLIAIGLWMLASRTFRWEIDRP